MNMKNIFVYLLILLLTAYPASAVDLNRWVLNVTLHEDGLVEEVIQAEIMNSGSSPMDGFSIVVPASRVTMIYDFGHTSSFTGMVVEQQAISGKTKIIINFNSSVEPGKTWNGRIGFTAENWAVKKDSNYSIDIPVEAPHAIVSGKDTAISVPADAEIRSQVFLPKAVEVTSVRPPPFRILFQYDRMVPTWSTDKLHIGDTINIEGSFSDVLNKIVETDELSRSLSDRIEEAKARGRDVSEAEAHLANANDYNTNQALASFWKKESTEALQYAGKASEELDKAEKILTSAGETTLTQTPEPAVSKKTPGFETPALISMFVIIYAIFKYFPMMMRIREKSWP